MRFQPGEPNPGPGAVASCQFEGKLVLAYSSGTSLIIIAAGELAQTLQLPREGIALGIDPVSGAICVALADAVLVYRLKRSYLRGSSWALDQTLPAEPLSCGWIDSQLLVVEKKSVWVWGESLVWRDPATPGEILSVAPDGQAFFLATRATAAPARPHTLYTRVSPTAFDFSYISCPPVCWASWSGPFLFVWCIDGGLRGFRPMPSGIYEIALSLFLPNSPILLEGPKILVGAEKYSLIDLEMGKIVRPRYRWKDRSLAKGPGQTYQTALQASQGSSTLLMRNSHSLALANLSLEPFEIRVLDSFTGHRHSIQQITRSPDGLTLFTQSHSQAFVWTSKRTASGETTLEKQSQIPLPPSPVPTPTCADLRDSRLATASDRLILWDISLATAHKEWEAPLPASPLCICFVEHHGLHLLAVFSNTSRAWKAENGVQLPELPLVSQTGPLNEIFYASIADQHPRLLSTVSKTHIQTWRLDTPFKWVETSALPLDKHTDPSHVKIKVSSRQRLAVSQGKRLVVWDALNQVIEFDQTLAEPIRDLDWTTTPTGDCLLGVGLSLEVIIYCPRRYDYTTRLEAWTPIRKLKIAKYTDQAIGDSIWLKDGTFLIGAGNQLFIQGAQIDVGDDQVRSLLRENNTISSLEQSSTLFDISSVLCGPLPVFHPQFLIQLVFTDRTDLAGQILCRLWQQLKYAHQDTVLLDYWLGLDLERLQYQTKEEFNPQVAQELEQLLKLKTLAYLTRHQQMTLLSVVQSLAQISQSLDTSGAKFMLGFHLFRLHSKTQPSMNMRDFVWGSLSHCKQVLLDAVEQVGATRSLEAFSQYGLMFWLERNALVQASEELAKRLFASTRDPVKVTLLYIAMGKKTLLASLWRVSSGHPERDKTMKLLANDFETPRWKSAALKNAYALMSKHRYEYAAALFLLGGACQDAVNILARQLNNLPLAFLVARLYEGDNGPAMNYLIGRFLKDDSPKPQDKDIYSHRQWSRVWAYITTGDFKSASQSAAGTDGSENSGPHHEITDPVLLWAYKHLRPKSALSLQGESDLLRRTTGVYCRMGCDLIALQICMGWKRRPTPTSAKKLAPAPAPMPPPVASAEPAPAAAQFDLSAFGF